MVRGAGTGRWAAVTVALVAAGTAIAGCGGGSSKSGGDSAAAGAKGSDGLAAALIASSASGATPKTVHVTADLVADGASQKLSGWLDYTAKLRADITVDDVAGGDAQAAKQMHLIVDGSAHYMSADTFRKSSAAFAKALGSKQWVKSDAGPEMAARENTAAAAFGVITLKSEPDPVKALAAVFSAGVLKANGAPGHYSGTVDAASLGGAKFDAAHRTAIDSAMKDASITAEKLEVWLDAKGVPARIVYTDTVSAGKKPSSGDVRFADWGNPVPEMKVPAAAETIGFIDLQKALQAG